MSRAAQLLRKVEEKAEAQVSMLQLQTAGALTLLLEEHGVGKNAEALIHAGIDTPQLLRVSALAEVEEAIQRSFKPAERRIFAGLCAERPGSRDAAEDLAARLNGHAAGHAPEAAKAVTAKGYGESQAHYEDYEDYEDYGDDGGYYKPPAAQPSIPKQHLSSFASTALPSQGANDPPWHHKLMNWVQRVTQPLGGTLGGIPPVCGARDCVPRRAGVDYPPLSHARFGSNAVASIDFTGGRGVDI